MKKLLGIFLIAAVGVTLGRAQSTAPVPDAAPPDVVTCIATQPELGCLMNWKNWVETTSASHGDSVQKLWSSEQRSVTNIANLETQIANIPAGPQGPAGQMGAPGPQGSPGQQGPSLNTPQIDTSALTASNPPASLVRTLCYPSNAYVGSVPTTGQSLDFLVNVATAGNYAIQACVASPGGAKTYHFEFPAGTKVGPTVTVVNTGSYQLFAYQATGVTLALPAGQSTIRVVLENGGMNLAGFNYR